MGKPTGFLDYERKDNVGAEPQARLVDYNEFHAELNENERKEQGARCMNCGAPFCQSGFMLAGAMTGCPLHNLIPEWNDEVYKGNYGHALARLLKTNPFPEFTGRVCPALCEKACILGSFDAPVTVRENELFIIENGYKNGLMTPRAPEVRTDKKVAVVGSGPSGLAVADRLNKRGHNVTVYERDDMPGGLLMYGIPNMKLDKGIVARRVNLMKKEGVTFVTGVDVGRDISADELADLYDAVVLCVGSRMPRRLGIEGENIPGIMYAVDFLTRSTKCLLGNLDEANGRLASGKRVVIVGGGDTGNDCVGTALRQGATSVMQLEIMPSPPEERRPDNPWPEWPRVKKTDYGQEEYIALYGSDPRTYETTVNKVITDDKGALAALETVKVKFVDRKMIKIDGSEKTIDCELLIIAAGFAGCESSLADAFGLTLDARGRLETVDYATSREGVFAAGDSAIGQSLVVRAIAEGRACAKAVDLYLMGYTNM